MKSIKFDFNNMLSFNVGRKDGVSGSELKDIAGALRRAHRHLSSLLNDRANRINIGLEWARLPFQDKKDVANIQRLGNHIAGNYRNVVFLGIGGSYLGLKAAQDALSPPYYNEFTKRRPRIYFEGNNLDPDTIGTLLDNLNPRKTFVVVISKSGETTEAKAALEIAEAWLKRALGAKYGRQIFAVTDPESGALRRKVERRHNKDALSFRSLPLMKGVGGRYSEFNMGLLHLAIVGIRIEEVFAGARAMAGRCLSSSIYKNPACMYAALNTILYRKKGKCISIMMPFSETLKSTADWYAQLLAESLGKKYKRRVRAFKDGSEEWSCDRRSIVNSGRTPVATRGTNDLHSIHQNNVEGENNKTVTFIRVRHFSKDLKVPYGTDFLSGRPYSELLGLAQEATAWALVKEKRPNCTIIMPEVTPYNWGELIFFFEMATAFEGELLGINAFDQPGVESYKNYMYYKLKRPGIARAIADDIERHSLIKRNRFII